MSEKYTTEECLQEYYSSLEEQLKEKEAMIDWLANQLAEARNKLFVLTGAGTYDLVDWRKAAQKAVRKNDK